METGKTLSYFLFTLCLGFQTSSCANFSCENEFNLHENEPKNREHFHIMVLHEDSFLTQRSCRTWKWPIQVYLSDKWKLEILLYEADNF